MPPEPTLRLASFAPLVRCWVCGATDLARVHQGIFDLDPYREQDPDLAAYTGGPLWLRRCASCGFGQPEALPALPRYFDRMYDQRWSADWIASEFDSSVKALIFRDVLSFLNQRVAADRRTLLDIGAHVGRFMHEARLAGWTAEGIELNPRTAAYAARRTGLPVYGANAESVAMDGRRFGAVSLIDVLEHIPDPVRMLRTAARLTEPGGWIAVKVPCGPSQLRKERVRAALRRDYRATIADNLVHVNHFSPRALRLALERAGFTNVAVKPAAPELPAGPDGAAHGLGAFLRLSIFRLARVVPGGVHLPLTLHLQAYGCLDAGSAPVEATEGGDGT